MSRRKIVAIVSAAVLLALCVLAVGLVVGVTQTRTGQGYIRDLVVNRIEPRVLGRLYVGRISGSFVEGLTIDSVELRGVDDSLVAASGRIRVVYDLRDLFDKRVLLKRVEVAHPVVRFEQAEDGTWNYKKAFRPQPPSTTPRTRGFGDYVVAESVTVRNASFILTQPWHLADSLRGARRDSAARYNVARKDAEIRRRGADFTRTWRWTDANVALSRARFAVPESTTKVFTIDRLSVNESDPPFTWRNVRGVVRILGDSVYADVPHWDLAGSTGSATAKVIVGRNGVPTRYDVRIAGDSVSLRDVAWVYPTLPTTGGGSLALRIQNDPADLHILRYALSRMDVRTTKSRLTGQMTFAVGGPVLGVQDVVMAAAPIDWDLLRTFNGKAFPYDFQGTLTGTVRARGGPLNRFVVDDARLAYADAHVPGAVSRFTGHGGLDILFPAYTVFRGFDLDVARLDLRTPQALNKNFPRVNGTVDGHVRLDSLWLDMRVSNADLTHRDGPGPPTHVTGGGRVTIGDKFLTYDLALQADPLSLTTLARSYPTLPARGVLAGPMQLKGTVDDLHVVTNLTGPAGTFAYDGVVDAYEPTYALRGHGSATGFDLRTFLGVTGDSLHVPTTSLAFAFDADVGGSKPGDLAGSLSLDVARSIIGGVRVYGGLARFGFADGRVRVDSLDVESTAMRLVGAGGLGLAPTATDSLRLRVTVDSLGGLRRYLASAPSDSLAGSLRLRGTLRGTIDTSAASRGLSLDALVDGAGLVVGGIRAATVAGELHANDLLRALHLNVAATGDSLAFGRVALTHASGTFATDTLATRPIAPVLAATRAPLVTRSRDGRFRVEATSDSGPALALAGRTAFAPETTRVVVDSGQLTVAPGRVYRLAAPADVVLARGANATTLDSLVLRDATGARVALSATLRDTGAVRADLALDRFPIADLVRLGAPMAAGKVAEFQGRLTAHAGVGGTRADPVMELGAAADQLRVAGVDVDSLRVAGRYGARRLVGDATLFRGGAALLAAGATLPVDLALTPVAQRQLGDSLRGMLRADSLDLALLGALLPSVQNVVGHVRTSAELRGTWQHPLLFGALRLDGGAATVLPAGIRVQGIAADLALSGDTLRVRRAVARSGGAGDTVSLTGTVAITNAGQAGTTPLMNPGLDLRLSAHNFLAIDRPRLATLWISTPRPLTITGRYLAATVRGAVRAERGRIYIPELIEKRIVDLSEYSDVVDLSSFKTRALVPAPNAFVENLVLDQVTLGVGNDVWLRSPEANIKLGGELAVTRARTSDFGAASREQLALTGALAVERGTYRLSLPPIAQPIFEVQPGTLRFFGTPDLNPTLDIRAVHTVRQAGRRTNRPDVRVQVTIGGTLNNPSLSLASPDDPSIATTDLISYLVTGEPAAVVLGQEQTSGADQAVALGLRLVGSYASGALTAGGPFDVVQVETVSSGQESTSILNSGRSILQRTRLAAGGQFGERTFYTFSAGLCGLGLGGAQSDVSFDAFRRGLGFRIEHRLTPTVSVQFGLEPGSSYQACGDTKLTTSVLQTPTQGGFDFLRSWSF